MILIFASPEEARELLGISPRRQTEIIRPQTSGPCVHYEDGTPYRCAYPYGDGACPHLDAPDVLCPVKDACYAMREVARLRETCEERDREIEREAAQVPQSDYVLVPPHATESEPEILAPAPEEEEEPTRIALPRRGSWLPIEDDSLRRAASAAVPIYRDEFGVSARTDGAIKARWYVLRKQITPQTPTPDFVGDTAPVTQCEAEKSKGFYGDARALHADMMDGMQCDRPLSQETEAAAEDLDQDERDPDQMVCQAPREGEKNLHPWIGMRVRVLDPLDLANRTGKVVEYSLDPREMLVALDGSLDRVWLPPESLLLIGAGGSA